MGTDYTLSLVVLSYVVAVTASHVTLLLAGRVRDPKSSAWKLWMAGGALAMGGGIWSMHFVAMLALRLPIQIVYDLPLTILSCAFGVLASGLALFTLRRLRSGARDILIPGFLIGLGIAAMHYTGMTAMKMSPAIRYDPLLFVLSVAVAIAAAIAALWIVFRVDNLRQHRVIAQFAAALIMGAAIFGMHFTGMGATNFDPQSICLASGLRINETWMAFTIGALSVVLLVGTMLLSLYDARLSSTIARSAERLQQANQELEQRVAERTRTLAREEARKDAILRGALDCIISMDAQGRIVEFNAAAEATFGYTRNEVIGRMLAQTIIPERYRGAHAAGLVRYLATGDTKVVGKRVEIPAQRRSGEEFPVELAITVVKVEGEHIFTAYLRDITGRKQAEQALRDAIEAAQSASQAKSAFVATMSHEIRTPMNAVIGLLELLSLTELTADQLETLSTIQESSRSLLTLIDDILDFSKIEAGKLEVVREPCAVDRVVDGVVGVFRAAASGKGLLLHHRIDSALCPAHLIDGTRLRQILNNFVSNAIKFSSSGAVTVEVKVAETTATSQTLHFTVRDSGIGMDPVALERLFQPFEQGESNTNRRFGGTGLGLAISRRLADLMGGKIEVTSAVGLGTRITLVLRAELADKEAVLANNSCLPASAPGNAVPAPFVDGSGHRKKLLIVDDHPTNLRMLKRQLKVLGLDADTAASGQEALDKWRCDGHELIITDCQMPEMDGYALARAIRAEQRSRGRPQPTVIAFTANSHREALEDCQKAGMNDYLTKPAELASLREMLARWLRPVESIPVVTPAQRTLPDSGEHGKLIDFARIRELVGDEGVAGILGEFRASTDGDVAMLQACIVQKDAREASRMAHRIKGAACAVGAERLALAAAEVERAARLEDLHKASLSVESLLRELTRLWAAVGEPEESDAATR